MSLSNKKQMFTSVPSSDQAIKLIEAIRDQTEGVPPHLVYVIDIVSVRFGGYFTAQVKAEIEKYQYLQMLTLNDCGIVSLQNFPNLPALIRLDMVFNQIPGEHLQYITPSKHIQTLMLGANRITKIQNLHPLRSLRKLLQLDLLNNEIVKIPGYRQQVFTLFPSLSILDTLDKIGKDAYNNSTMLEAVSRIPDNLFDKSIPVVLPPLPPVHRVVHDKQKSKLKKALARTGSLDSVSHKGGAKGKGLDRAVLSGKLSKKSVGRSRASRAGLQFPVGRIKRKLKQLIVGQRIGIGGAVYLSAVLQYLTAELVQIAGNEAKRGGKKRITPICIRDALKSDDQLKRLLSNVTIGLGNE